MGPGPQIRKTRERGAEQGDCQRARARQKREEKRQSQAPTLRKEEGLEAREAPRGDRPQQLLQSCKEEWRRRGRDLNSAVARSLKLPRGKQPATHAEAALCGAVFHAVHRFGEDGKVNPPIGKFKGIAWPSRSGRVCFVTWADLTKVYAGWVANKRKPRSGPALPGDAVVELHYEEVYLVGRKEENQPAALSMYDGSGNMAVAYNALGHHVVTWDLSPPPVNAGMGTDVSGLCALEAENFFGFVFGKAGLPHAFQHVTATPPCGPLKPGAARDKNEGEGRRHLEASLRLFSVLAAPPANGRSGPLEEVDLPRYGALLESSRNHLTESTIRSELEGLKGWPARALAGFNFCPYGTFFKKSNIVLNSALATHEVQKPRLCKCTGPHAAKAEKGGAMVDGKWVPGCGDHIPLPPAFCEEQLGHLPRWNVLRKGTDRDRETF